MNKNTGKEYWGVYRTHCCVLHGCKYGEVSTCPVCNGQVKQEYLCEDCDKTKYMTDHYSVEDQWRQIDNRMKLEKNELRVKKIKRILKKKKCQNSKIRKLYIFLNIMI
jgi:hypothetical protein